MAIEATTVTADDGVGIVRGHTLLADALASSVEQHARFGGVVPEVASRAHLEAMVPTMQRALDEEAADAALPLERRLQNDDATERAETVDNLRQIALLRLEALM